MFKSRTVNIIAVTCLSQVKLEHVSTVYTRVFREANERSLFSSRESGENRRNSMNYTITDINI